MLEHTVLHRILNSKHVQRIFLTPAGSIVGSRVDRGGITPARGFSFRRTSLPDPHKTRVLATSTSSPGKHIRIILCLLARIDERNCQSAPSGEWVPFSIRPGFPQARCSCHLQLFTETSQEALKVGDSDAQDVDCGVRTDL